MQSLQIQSISLEELIETLREIIKEELSTISRDSSEDNTFLTRQEAADLLGVSLTTIDTYRKERVLRFYKPHGRVRFVKSEFIEDIKKLN